MTGSEETMKSQWNEIAEENAFFGVRSTPEFESAQNIDMQAYWRTGEVHARNLLAETRVGQPATKTMVEIGCGNGRMTHYFSRTFQHVHALDISGKMIAQAKQHWRKLDNVRFLESSGSDLLPIHDKSVDFVFSFYVLNHVTDPQIVLNYIKECARVLNGNGSAFLHFRVCNVGSLSFLQKIRLLHARKKERTDIWWEAGIERKSCEYTTDTISQFGKFDAWHGSEVSFLDVVRTVHGTPLRIRSYQIFTAPNTAFLFLDLVKAG